LIETFQKTFDIVERPTKRVDGVVSVNKIDAVAFPIELQKKSMHYSWRTRFAKRYIPSIFPTASIIYYQLSDKDI
jgi:hypothetical protein